MDNIENCADCGKKFGFTERIFSKTNGLWICEDCAITQMQENDNKDKKIADLEAKLAESDKLKDYDQLKQQLAENAKYKEWVLEFLEKHNINTDSTPEYSENPIIEYCEQVKDFRECDNKEIEMLLSAKQASEEQILDIVSNTAYQHNPIQLEIEQLKQQLVETNKLMQEYLSKCLSLEQQLAEKDKKIEYQESMKILAVKNQNQTAIAELEEVKNIIDSKVKNIDKRLDDLNIKIVCESTSMQLSTYKEIVKLIDQQIKSLKGEK